MLRALLFGALAMMAPALAQAHGVGQRIDLPIPLDLYVIGGAAVVALSFLAVWFLPPNFLARLENYPKLELRFLNWLASKYMRHSLKLLSLGLFILAVWAGLFGVQNSAENILPTTVWVMFSVGITFFSAFLGNIWGVINPIKSLHEYASRLMGKLNTPKFQWRATWDLWPAVAAFLLFRWIENVFSGAAEPSMLAWLVLAFTAYSLVGMTLFGREVWLRHADPFAIFFSFLSRFAVVGTSNEGALHLRPPAVGLLRGIPTTSGTFFVLLMISGVTADGFFDTPTMTNLIEWSGVSIAIMQTAGLIVLFGTFTLLYYALSWFVTVLVPNVMTAGKFARHFVFSLLPIAVAYEFAHYASLLVLEGQRFLALLSDPLGRGLNLLGTAQLEINYTLINLKILWDVQVFAIVLGHVIAVLIAHAIAERVFKERDHVLASQYPLLVAMLLYTMFSLWIIAQPIVA